MPNIDVSDSVRQEPSSLTFLNILLRQRRLFLTATAVVVVVVVGLSLAMPPRYSVTTSFVAKAEDRIPTGIPSIFAQFGVMTAGGGGESPQFYADLISSRTILDAVAVTEFEVTAPERRWFSRDSVRVQGELAAIYGIQDGTLEERRLRAVERLERSIAVSVRPNTGVVSFIVTERWPTLALQVAERVLELLEEFNLNTRQSQAREERRFVGERLAEARLGLREAEDSLEHFLDRNRGDLRNSPQLSFVRSRLERDVTLRQEVLISLSESYERARIDEVRNTPVITLVEPPQLPIVPDRRHLILRGMLGLMIGAMLALVIAVWRYMLVRARKERPAEYAELLELRQETLDGVKSVLRLGRRRDREGS